MTGLDAGVEGIETAASGQADGVLLVKLIDSRFKFNQAERRARADQRIVPEPSVEEHFTRMRFVVAWPLNSAELLQALVAHASVHGAQAAAFIPDPLGFRLAPVMAEPSRQIKENRHVVPHALGRIHGAAHALHPPLARCDRSFAFEGAPR